MTLMVTLADLKASISNGPDLHHDRHTLLGMKLSRLK
jgi:hypothetical protein